MGEVVIYTLIGVVVVAFLFLLKIIDRDINK